MTTDRDLLRALGRHLRKHDVGCFDPDGDDQVRAHALVDWFAESVDTLNVPASENGQMAAPSPKAVEDGWACLTCGSPRWVAASLTGPVSYGGRAIRQCVPCGRYSDDPVNMAVPASPPDAEHRYLSTACWHAQRDPDEAGRLHAECGVDATRWDGTHKTAATCKWCPAPCVCGCHSSGPGATQAGEQGISYALGVGQLATGLRERGAVGQDATARRVPFTGDDGPVTPPAGIHVVRADETPRDLVIFHGRAAQLAREVGVPVFLDGDTGEVVRASDAEAQDSPATWRHACGYEPVGMPIPSPCPQCRAPGEWVAFMNTTEQPAIVMSPGSWIEMKSNG